MNKKNLVVNYAENKVNAIKFLLVLLVDVKKVEEKFKI